MLTEAHRSEVARVLVITLTAEVLHEGADLGIKVSRQVVVLEQDPVLGLPALPRSTTHVTLDRKGGLYAV